MQVGILGPLEVRGDDGEPIEVAGARLRTLLTRLALDAGRPVGVTALVDAVWGDHPPADEANALQTLVSRLRRVLGAATLIAQSPAGYRLGVAAEDVDVHRFVAAATAGSAALRERDPQTAVRCFDQALALWRGPALVDAGDSGEAQAVRLHDQREAVRLDRADALLALGRTSGLVAELEARVTERPTDERLAGQLLRALALAGRPADALARYERLRARLGEELGVDPSPELQAVHLAVLRGELAGAGNGVHPADELVAEPPRRTNLRAQLTSFVGRDDEVARIGKSLEQNRLVTLVGPGGAGKTRLAAEAAAVIVDHCPDGVWLVELAPITDAADLAQTVLGSLGVREAHLLDRRSQLGPRAGGPSAGDGAAGGGATSRLLDALAGKDAILILDNCEHLVEASARLADLLLARCPRLRVLTTSREPLGITGEVLIAVPPLGQPEPSAGPAEAMAYPAVRLFADRAAAVVPGFAVDDATIGTVVEIVRRLDGLPLAIELAAARLRGMPLSEIAERLSDRFRLLTGGSRTAMPRHRTLRAVVEWSWDLLTAPERLLVERLAVFPAGATVASASAVCAAADVPAEDVPDLLAALVDKSLLQPVEGGARLRMLETIREYGIERLGERGGDGAGELAELRHRHADYFAGLLAEAEPHLIRGDQLPWFALLRAERDNIVAALRYRTDSGDTDGALQVAVRLAGFATLLGNHGEVPGLLADVLRAPGVAEHQLYWLGEALYAMNTVMGGAETDPAGLSAEAALARMKQIRPHLNALDVDSHPFVGLLKVAIAFFAGDTEGSERYIAEVLSSDSAWTAAAVLMFRGSMAENDGNLAGMRADSQAALAEFRRLGERWGTASALRVVALLHTYDGDLDAAEAAYREALELMAEMGSSDDEGFLRVRLADLRMRRGDLAAAREQVRLARVATERTGGSVGAIFMQVMNAVVELEAGNRAEAVRLYDDAQQQVERISPANPIRSHAYALVQIIGVTFALSADDLDEAWRRLADVYPIAVATSDMPIIASTGVAHAQLLARGGDPVAAATALGAAAALRGAEDPTAVDIARLTAGLTAELGRDRFAAAFAAGRELDRDAALARLDPAG